MLAQWISHLLADQATRFQFLTVASKNSQDSPSLKKKWVYGLTLLDGRGMMLLAMKFVLMVKLASSFCSTDD